MQAACFAEKLVSLNRRVRVSILLVRHAFRLPLTYIIDKACQCQESCANVHYIETGYPSDPNSEYPTAKFTTTNNCSQIRVCQCRFSLRYLINFQFV